MHNSRDATMDNHQAVYQFKFSVAGVDVAPSHMWGTLEAISRLGEECRAIEGTERQIDGALLDLAGFYYEN